MDSLRTPSLVSRPTSAHPSSPSPPSQPTNDDIEAVIQMATAARQTPDGRPAPIKDTRTQLFVGNLPYRVRWQDLKDLFRRAGTVLRADVSLGPDNRSRGYGTVLLATAEDAGRAIDMFHGYSWQTRILEVRPDRLPLDFDNPLPLPPPTLPFPAPSPATFTSSLTSATLTTSPSRSVRSLSDDFDSHPLFGSEGPTPSSSTCRNIFVGNLPFHCQWQDLKDLFRQAGNIVRADVALGPDGRSRGFGTVVSATEQDAERAVKMFNGYEYNGRTLKVHFDRYSHFSQPSSSPTHPTFQQAMPSTPMNPPSFTTTMTSRPTHINLPLGYHSEFLTPSGPSSPYDLYHSKMTMFAQPAQAQQGRLHSRSQPQQNESPPQSLTESNSRSIDDVDALSGKLASTSMSTDSGSASPPQTSKLVLNQLEATLSSDAGAWNNSTPSAEQPSQAQKATTTAAVTSSPPHNQHPHHPGPISLPPPTLPFPMPPHTISPLHHPSMTIPISPIQHPSMGSPLHHPSAYPPAHPQMVSITPHGLPPITPSMPPFIFHPVSASPTSAHTPATHMPMFTATSFSPTVAMSPGAFYGRPGNPNPFINPTVGAPVHMHSPGATRQNPGGSTYFYPPPGAGRVEPTGYFDPAYFPPGSQHTVLGSSGLSKEILEDEQEVDIDDHHQEKNGVKTAEGNDKAGGKEGEGTPSTEGSVGDDGIGRSTSRDSTSGTTVSEATSWSTSEESGDDGPDLKVTNIGSGLGVGILGEEKKVISRTHSMSGRPKPLFFNPYKSDSDPPTRTTSSGQGDKASPTVPGWPAPLISLATQLKGKAQHQTMRK